MKAGMLHHRIALQSITGYTKNDVGEKTPTWTTYATVWASLKPVGGADFSYEKVRTAQSESVVTHDIIIRYNESVTPKHRIVFGTRVFTIVNVLNKEERGIWTTLRSEEVVT